MRYHDRDWPPAAKQFWLVAGAICCIVWGGAIFARLRPPYGGLHDYAQEWTSARNYFERLPVYLDMRESIPRHFQGQFQADWIEFNAHPPPSVLLALPFGLLDYTTSFLAWTGCSLVALVISLRWTMRPAGLAYSAWSLLPLATFLVTSNPFAQQVNQGQLNLFLLLLLTTAWVADRDDRPLLSGAMIGAATAIKLFPGFLILYFLAQRRWAALASSIVSCLLLHLATGLVLGWDCYQDYFKVVVPKVADFRDYWLNASLMGYWSKLFDPRSGHVVALWANPLAARAATAISALCVTLATAWKCSRAQSPPERDLAFALCVVAMLLVSPVTWDHYFVLLVLPLLVLWATTPPTPVARSFLVATILLLGFVNPQWIWKATIPGDGELALGPGAVPSVAAPAHTLTVISYPFYCLCALFLFTLLSRAARPPRFERPYERNAASPPEAAT